MELAIVLSSFFLLILNTADVSGIRISEKKCDDYRKLYSSTSKKFNETAEDAAQKEFPFMARIMNATRHYNNGVLISENFVLSIAPDLLPGKMVVKLGDLDMGTDKDDTRPHTYDVIKTVVHPNFNVDDRNSNVRLYKLNESIKFDDYVRPACLPAYESSIPKKLLEIGWSSTIVRTNYRLHKLQMHHTPNESCKVLHKNQSKYIRNIDNGTIFCAAAKDGDRRTCSGHFGSALINTDPDASYKIIGIVSVVFVGACNYSSPDICVRVSSYIDWIEINVWPAEKTSRVIATESSTPKQTVKPFEKISTKVESTTKMDAIKNSTRPDITDNGMRSFQAKCILIITVILILLMLSTSIVCLKVLLSRNRQTALSVQLIGGYDYVVINPQTQS